MSERFTLFSLISSNEGTPWNPRYHSHTAVMCEGFHGSIWCWERSLGRLYVWSLNVVDISVWWGNALAVAVYIVNWYERGVCFCVWCPKYEFFVKFPSFFNDSVKGVPRKKWNSLLMLRFWQNLIFICKIKREDRFCQYCSLNLSLKSQFFS